MHSKNIYRGGNPLEDVEKALIMIHGRGASANDILELAPLLNLENFALIAPQATNSTWYPYSFLEVAANNEPWLSSALDLLNEIVTDIVWQGIPQENIYFLGFSQGACLTLEFVARNAAKYGGVVAFTGGLIGDRINRGNYAGDFERTPIFIGSSNPDSHVPVERVMETTVVLSEMNADVTEKIYDNMGHTISHEEIDLVNSLVFK